MKVNSQYPIQVGQVQIWHASIKNFVAGISRQQIENVLSKCELEALGGYSDINVRNEYLAARYLVRGLLSYYSPNIHPRDWKFEKNEFGKPTVSCKLGTHNLEFNISHSAGIIVCAFSIGATVGVDIESRSRKIEWHEMAQESFSAAEARELGLLTPEKVPQRFFEYWTLKEAFIKAKGMGLSLPLGEFSFLVSEHFPIRIEFSKFIPENPQHWQFRLFEVVPGYQCAIAVKIERKSQVALLQMGDCSDLFGAKSAA